MPTEARRDWRRILRAMRHYPLWLREVDVAIFEAFVMARYTYEVAERDVLERGQLLPGRSSADKARGGALVRNPSLAIARDAAEQMRRFGKELGFSPSSRGQVDQGFEDDDPDLDSASLMRPVRIREREP